MPFPALQVRAVAVDLSCACPFCLLLPLQFARSCTVICDWTRPLTRLSSDLRGIDPLWESTYDWWLLPSYAFLNLRTVGERHQEQNEAPIRIATVVTLGIARTTPYQTTTHVGTVIHQSHHCIRILPTSTPRPNHHPPTPSSPTPLFHPHNCFNKCRLRCLEQPAHCPLPASRVVFLVPTTKTTNRLRPWRAQR